ncbi:histidine ammonia-lyase [Paraburkholderia domus]|jgi:histidine ammonia-lyase|uniref:Histidine ammonia-lyase n=1 Tax=Paraburkholderia domus TaxID=2793075 RepID=A0A9N8N474_9BURK|nr:histidine ammonia-lyase [Paraburkholderia domus]MBK5054052.1 histidine ammonia-lyase [Burkholderia sp. R-70006]MBK5064451.1 histidine ammonia-lyase [Burkholderia sp. R-70199]MBK5122463.1 histidine ammonia-lyase [Burkholderia sp. R-69980]MBK5168423.1 histidine ammonia-lyase [Burkholderia sp. R-70211]MBK5183761.1 histidine ammonia-lyase [Burkholderia sp. R-69749]MCI0149269.1 histidine ammonia-lyase [Paraburkholderia sediminicola]
MKQIDNLITLVPGKVRLDQLRSVLRNTTPIEIDPSAFPSVERSHAVVDDVIARGAVVYGINTGFGKMAQTVIPADKLAELQKNLVLSHSVGTGELLADSTVRLIMALKAISLARGHSGVRSEAIHALVRLLNAGVYPCIPAKGSVGASGDLAPLAHMTAVLIGVGHARVDGKRVTALEGLRHAGLEPLQLGPKEGLAFLNGTQVSTALALVGLFAAEDVFASAVLAGALSLEAIRGSLAPFDSRIHAARGQPGQIDVAAAYRALLEDSPIVASHHDCGRVQDPYSIRCQPQVMGACLDQLRHAAEVLRIEANAASDNPLVFADEGDVLSGGNFHAEPVAIAADNIAIAIAEIGAISERRLALLLDSNLSGLPPFLVADGGLHSGFMIAQVTAAALASENKSLAHPASVDSLPTSANQEDHVSMATFAARRLGDMAENTAVVVGIEAMAAAQGIEFHRPLRSTATLEAVIGKIRESVAFYEKDRFFADDIAAMKAWVTGIEAPESVARTLPSHRAATV